MQGTFRSSAKGAVQILEEAFALINSLPINILSLYYIGTLPFVTTFLYFWAHMSRSPYASEHCAPAALVLALLFVWMKIFQTLFCQELYFGLTAGKPALRSWKRLLQIAANQTFIHSCALIVLPLALIFAIPFAWCFAFFQNVTVLDGLESRGLKNLCSAAWRQARLWPGQNHLALSFLFLLAFFVCINLAAGIYILPMLLKKLTGIESLFSRTGLWVFNTTFWAVVLSLGYICLDPLFKTFYVLRCFYGLSLRNAQDLLGRLRRIVPGTSIVLGMAVLATAVFLGGGNSLAADRTKNLSQEDSLQKYVVNGHKLSASVQKILKDPDFSWRLPQNELKPPENNQGFIGAAFSWLADNLSASRHWLGKQIQKIGEFFKGILQDMDLRAQDGGIRVSGLVYWIFFVLLVLVIARSSMRFLARRKREKQRQVRAEMQEGADISIDMENQKVRGDELPVKKWLDMAADFLDQGQFLLAMRAYYFAVLAHLSEQGLLSLAGYKSNLDYKRELQRRASEFSSLQDMFAWSVTVLDRAWYGLQEISRTEFSTFTDYQKKILSWVKHE